MPEAQAGSLLFLAFHSQSSISINVRGIYLWNMSFFGSVLTLNDHSHASPAQPVASSVLVSVFLGNINPGYSWSLKPFMFPVTTITHILSFALARLLSCSLYSNCTGPLTLSQSSPSTMWEIKFGQWGLAASNFSHWAILLVYPVALKLSSKTPSLRISYTKQHLHTYLRLFPILLLSL